MKKPSSDEIRESVRKRYASIVTVTKGASVAPTIAKTSSQGCCGPTCCSPQASEGAIEGTRLGYSEQELAAVPEGANLGLGCGNPQAIADLQPGEVVLDLGSGAGFDSFLAARRVGPTGKVIGVDMTSEMIAKARENARASKMDHVEFRLGEIEHLPVANDTVDVILSNCVINLSPDKPQVFAEAYRVLKAGGRLAISDVVAVKNLPAKIKSDLDKHGGCIAGAATVVEVQGILASLGFREIKVMIREESREFIRDWFPGSGVEEFVRSAVIQARK